MLKRLFFVEFKDEARRCVELFNSKGASPDSVVALSPAAQLILKRNQIHFQTSCSFFDNQAHARALVFSEECLQLIEGSSLIEEGFSKEFTHCLRFHINHLAWLAEIISEALNRVEVDLLMIPSCHSGQTGIGWKLQSEDRPLGLLLRGLAARRALPWQIYTREQIGVQKDLEDGVGPPSWTSGALSPISALLLRYLEMWARQKRLILVSNSGYGLDLLAAGLSDRPAGTEVLTIDSRPIESRLTALLRLIGFGGRFVLNLNARLPEIPLFAFTADPTEPVSRSSTIQSAVEELARRVQTEWKECFEYRGIDLSSVVARRVRFGFAQHLQDMAAARNLLGRVLKALSPALVCSQQSTGTSAVLGRLCSEMGFPSVMIPHGSLAPPRNRFEEIEQRRLSQAQMSSDYQYVAAQTPLAEAHAVHFGLTERVIRTGPLLFRRADFRVRDAVRKRLGICPEEQVILYAVAQRKRSSMRFQIFETEDETFLSMADVVRSVKQLEGTRLIIKLHPSSEYSEDEIKNLLPSCSTLVILHKEPFAEVLAAADLLVSYISTTVEEALMSQIPVVLYDRWARYCHGEAAHCRELKAGCWDLSAAYYVTEPALLRSVLQHALANAGRARRLGLFDRYNFESANVMPFEVFVRKVMESGEVRSDG